MANKSGRPPGVTKEKTVAVCKSIASGSFIETAVVAAGVPKSTFYRWLRHAREDEEAGKRISPYLTFSRNVQRALAKTEMVYLEIIKDAAKVHWPAAAWMLERRFPERWAKPRSTARAA